MTRADPVHPLREARIDLGAIRANIGVLRALTAPAAVMAIVKADAYGHGAVPVARAAVEAGAAATTNGCSPVVVRGWVRAAPR